MADQALTIYSDQLTQYEPHFAKVLPTHMSSEKLIRMAQSAVRINPSLLECQRQSLMQSIMTGAILGLEIDGVTGQAFLVPFKGKVQLIIGYKGYVTLAFNSGYILEGREVRQNDEFRFEYGLHPNITHQFPNQFADAAQRGEVKAAYAVARHMQQNMSTFKVVMLDEILAARDMSSGYQYAMSKGKKDTPWIAKFSEMAKKTAIRALADQLPLNVQRAIALDTMHEQTGKPTYYDDKNNLLVDDSDDIVENPV